MNDYGKGSLLSSATVLPATTAMALTDQLHPMVLVGFIGVTSISLIVTISYITRYLRNRD